MNVAEISEHTFSNDRHRSFYRAAGPEDGPLVIFCHGWPELSLSWRHQLPFLGAMGFRAIAPDMRGYGGSSVYSQHADYALTEVVQDMLDLLDELGQANAIWVGHDWGTPVVWSIASHHPSRCRAAVGLCVPYATLCQGLDFLLSHVDREVYPSREYPAGQWDYMLHYRENFAEATRPMDANPATFVKAIFRKGSPDGKGQPAATAMVRKQGGWLGGLPEAPDMPMDEDVISESEVKVYADHLSRNGFFGPNAWYMNHEANAEYYKQAVNDGRLSMPVLFLHARYDYVCETMKSTLAEPMRSLCDNLTESVIDSGHWMAQEKPADVNRELANWLAAQNLAPVTGESLLP